MGIGYLGFFLLIWFPGVLHAQSEKQPCPAPNLVDGYFVPEISEFEHESNLTYACDRGRKPAVEGWWATSTCQDGKWIHTPECIGKNNCLPPDIPNAEFIQKNWYEERDEISITCENGYEPRDQQSTAECVLGTWSSALVCEKSLQACDAPSVIPHAVIISQGYQDVFPADSEVHYQCEDGFVVNRAANKSSILCSDGKWTTAPPCRKVTADLVCGVHPDVSGSTVEQTDAMTLKYTCTGEFDTLAGSETVVCNSDGSWSPLPVCKRPCVVDFSTYGDSFVPSGIEYIKEGQSRDVACSKKDHGSLFRCTGGKILITNDCRAATGPGGGDSSSTGSGAQAAGAGSSTTSASPGSRFTRVERCGPHPVIPNGYLVEETSTFLKFKCNPSFTKLGLETVMCDRNGTWSTPPVCKAPLCVIDHALLKSYYVDLPGVESMEDKQQERIACHANSNYYRTVVCDTGRITFSDCCHYQSHNQRRCYTYGL